MNQRSRLQARQAGTASAVGRAAARAQRRRERAQARAAAVAHPLPGRATGDAAAGQQRGGRARRARTWRQARAGPCRVSVAERAGSALASVSGRDGQALLERRAVHAGLGHDRRDVGGGRDVEGGIRDRRCPRARAPRPPRLATSSAARSSIGISRAARDRVVDRRGGRDDVAGHAVRAREHRERVRADLVGGVAVVRDAVGAEHDGVDEPAREQLPGGDVGDQRVRDAVLGQLPGGQAGSLQQRARLVDPDVQARIALRAPRARRRAPSRSRPWRARRRCSA